MLALVNTRRASADCEAAITHLRVTIRKIFGMRSTTLETCTSAAFLPAWASCASCFTAHGFANS